MKLDKAAILIKKAALEFDKISIPILGLYDLTDSQYKVIKFILAKAPQGVRLADLEKYFSMTHPTAIGIVQNLQKKGLAQNAENPHDARSHYIVPTEKALAMREELTTVGNRLEAELTKNLTEIERKRLVSLLRKMLAINGED